MQAREVMSEGVMSIAADATVLQAAELLVNSRVGAMPVLDKDGTMIGIVSLADLIGAGQTPALGSSRDVTDDARAVAHRLAMAMPVTDIMTKDVVMVADDTPLVEVARTMRAHRIKRVPVVRDGEVVGIVSRIDILKALISYGAPSDPRPAFVTDPDDARLRDAIIAAMSAMPGHSIQNPDVVVMAAVVHLWGVAPNDMTRRNCEALAQKIPGVKHVMNHMHVPATAAG